MRAFDDKSLWSQLLGVPRSLTIEKNIGNFVSFSLKRVPRKPQCLSGTKEYCDE
jgi:hypothetical protein